MLPNYDPDIPDVVVPTPTRLRRVSKLLREMASGPLTQIEDKEKIKQYKQLLFTAAKGIDEAAKLLPNEPDPPVNKGHAWWCWLLLGGASILVPFLLWVAYHRYILGNRIGFIP